MPTYEYACKECGEHQEVVQSFKDEPLTKCPACGGRLRKVFGNIGIAFKGSGFYKTDSRTAAAGSKTAAGAASGGSGGSDSGAAKTDGAPAKSDSAPATPAAKPASSSSTPASGAAAS